MTKPCQLIIGGLVSDKTKSLTGIGFMGDKTMSADFLRFSEL